MASSKWCVIYGTPGQDPLTVQGPLSKTEADKLAARAVEERPDIAAVVDEMVGPKAPLAKLKHGSYDAPTHLIARVRSAAEALEADMEKLKLPQLDRRGHQRALQDAGDLQRPGSPHDEHLIDTLVRLKLLSARVRRR